MFSKGQIIFAVLFFVAFVIGIFLAYRKDKENNLFLFKGSYKIVLLVLIIFFGLFGIVKIKHLFFP